MMKTTVDIENVLYQLLRTSPLATEITGKVYKGSRPDNSDKEDVVINSLPVTAFQLQRAVGNVNIFVKDKQFDIAPDGIIIKPDEVRLDELAKLAIPVVSDVYAGGCYLTLQQQQIFEDTGNKQHLVNLRIDFYIPNI